MISIPPCVVFIATFVKDPHAIYHTKLNIATLFNFPNSGKDYMAIDTRLKKPIIYFLKNKGQSNDM